MAQRSGAAFLYKAVYQYCAISMEYIQYPDFLGAPYAKLKNISGQFSTMRHPQPISEELKEFNSSKNLCTNRFFQRSYKFFYRIIK